MQQNQLMKRTAVYTVLFACCALSVIFYYSSHKMIVVADVAQDEAIQSTPEGTGQNPQGAPAPGQENGSEALPEQNNILFAQNGQEMNYFCIPLHTDVKAESVTIENHYMDKELWVSIKQEAEDAGYESFYRTQGVYGNRSAVIDGRFENGADAFRLKFRLTDIYEYHSIFEDNKLYIEFMTPKEAYDKIVVIDPAYGGGVTGAATDGLEGKDITLEIARALKKKLDETDIKVYYTRMDDSEISEEDRVGLTNAAKADMLIRIEINENADSKIYGTEAVYNRQFFIPGFGNLELADLLEKEVVTAISGKANGIFETDQEDTVLNEATVPAAAIRVGYLSNGQEKILLAREDYIQKIAEGIYQAIMKAYDD
ncbi:MAG: N-acetylmuramoyl-L-alanine amidase [Roseburia sp.]|nr:N-acetylmuramoyl-L-alanine amidase [Roseburia sp.]MCM1201620.1 N-acetylmuramoyl-L-alanine amidase [Bacteroides fragilis]